MIKIKIIRNSIRKNPDAGKDYIIVGKGADISFETTEDIPSEFDQENDVLVTQAHDDGRKAGIIANPASAAKLALIPGFTIKVKHNHETIHTAPQSQYFYKYEDPLIKCDSCKEMVPNSEIIIDYEYDGYDEYRFEMCPRCKKKDTFEDRIYESISEINDKEKPSN